MYLNQSCCMYVTNTLILSCHLVQWVGRHCSYVHTYSVKLFAMRKFWHQIRICKDCHARRLLPKQGLPNRLLQICINEVCLCVCLLWFRRRGLLGEKNLHMWLDKANIADFGKSSRYFKNCWGQLCKEALKLWSTFTPWRSEEPGANPTTFEFTTTTPVL
jgi:hypothetical protein